MPTVKFNSVEAIRQAFIDRGLVPGEMVHIGGFVKDPQTGRLVEHYPDDHDGMQHYRMWVNGEINGEFVSERVGVWKDPTGHYADAGGALLETEKGAAKRLLAATEATEDPQVAAAVALVTKLIGVVGAQAAGVVPGGLVVQALLIENGIAQVQRYVVYKDADGKPQTALLQQEATP